MCKRHQLTRGPRVPYCPVRITQHAFVFNQLFKLQLTRMVFVVQKPMLAMTVDR